MRVRNTEKEEKEKKVEDAPASHVNVKNTQLKRKKEVKFCQDLGCNLLKADMTMEGSDNSLLV